MEIGGAFLAIRFSSVLAVRAIERNDRWISISRARSANANSTSFSVAPFIPLRPVLGSSPVNAFVRTLQIATQIRGIHGNLELEVFFRCSSLAGLDNGIWVEYWFAIASLGFCKAVCRNLYSCMCDDWTVFRMPLQL